MAQLVPQLASLLRLGRVKFLLGGLALFGLGTTTAYFMGHGFNLRSYVWGQVAVTAIQLMTHYSNDYFDLEADRANLTPTPWSGGSRVLVRGELPRWVALAAALFLIAVASIATAALTRLPSVPAGLTLLVFGSMLVLSWSYSSPPLRLHSKGLGELAVITVVPFLTPLSGFLLQAGTIEPLAVLLTLPLVLLQLVMLLTLQIPDAQGDRMVGKRTWTVLFGVRPVVLLCSGLLLSCFLLGFFSSTWGAPHSMVWVWACLTPLGIYQHMSYLRGDHRKPRAYARLAFASVALFFLAIIGNLLSLLSAGSITV